MKDLRILGVDLKNIVLVDNSAYSFGLQLDNGIPILPFYEDESDDELLHLSTYLQVIASSEDMRIQNRRAF